MCLAYADRLAGWLELAHLLSEATLSRLASVFCQYFQWWGASESVSTDSGTNLTSKMMGTFFGKWEMEQRVVSIHFPQSNGRADAAVVCQETAFVLTLQYLKTPLRGVDKSLAQLAMVRQLRDGIPPHRQHYRVDIHWQQALRAKEREAVRQDRMDRQTRHTQDPSPISTRHPGVGSTRVWKRRGVITQVRSYRQYTVKLEGRDASFYATVGI